MHNPPIMILRFIFLMMIIPVLSSGQAADTSGKRPDMSRLNYEDVKWTKAEGSSFWFYYKPSLYFFKNTEFETIALENGDILIYLFDPGLYLLLPDYTNTEKNKEQPVGFVTARSCVFVRRSRGAFWIYDKGQYVSNLERIGMNTQHQYVFRSGLSDKRYWIEEYDFVFGKIAKPVGILSE